MTGGKRIFIFPSLNIFNFHTEARRLKLHRTSLNLTVCLQAFKCSTALQDHHSMKVSDCVVMHFLRVFIHGFFFSIFFLSSFLFSCFYSNVHEPNSSIESRLYSNDAITRVYCRPQRASQFCCANFARNEAP